MNVPPNKWTFDGLQRDPKTGKFDDDALANILQNATEIVAQSFRARGTPDVMRVVEMLAIEQSRTWGVCTLNEFRQFLGLKGSSFRLCDPFIAFLTHENDKTAYASFEEWNPNPEIASAARAMYSHIDCLELYVRLESVIPFIPGVDVLPVLVPRLGCRPRKQRSRGRGLVSVPVTPSPELSSPTPSLLYGVIASTRPTSLISPVHPSNSLPRA